MLLATTIMLVGAMAAAMNWSFQKGFLDYLTEIEVASLDQTVADLSNAYRREGSWDYIRGNHSLWMTFLPVTNKSADNQSASRSSVSSPAKLSIDQLPPLPGGRRMQSAPLPPADQNGLSTRLRLLDEHQNRIIGPPDNTGSEVIRPIELEGDIVGWLSLTPQTVPAGSLENSFRTEQLNAIYPIAAGALLLALVVGIPLGRYLLRPVKEVARGAHSLAMGKFDIRLKAHSRDELGQLAIDFNFLAEVLQRNERLRRQGMADISHELRTPLALLRGEIEAMQDGIRPLDQPQLAKLLESNLQLSRLVDDLYDLALTDAGALSYKKEMLNLAALLHCAAEGAEYLVLQQRLTITQDIPEQLMMYGDARRLRQVLDNLIKNSRLYTDAGGVIAVSAWQSGDRACLRIEDSAPSVTDEVQARLFDRFFRAEGSRNRATGGAGLGLAICRNIIEAHQGVITARPSDLGGLCIDVQLPLSNDR